MANAPLKDQADEGYEQGSEDKGYILHEFKKAVGPNTKGIFELKESFGAFQDAFKFFEAAYLAKGEFYSTLAGLTKSNDTKYPSKTDLSQLAKFCTNALEFLKCECAEVTLTPAEMLALNATPKVIFPKLAGSTYEIVRFELFMDYATTAYTGIAAAEDLSLEFETSGEIMSIETTGFLDQTSDQRRMSTTSSNIVGEDEDVRLKLLSGEILTGDSPVKLKLHYRVIELLT